MTRIQLVLGSNLKKHRRAKGWTQAVLAEKAGTVGNYIALLESAAKFPSADMIERIASALEIDSTALFIPEAKEFTTPWDWNKNAPV
jgi:transcriptional regulator with XRE-family HTH domain